MNDQTTFSTEFGDVFKLSFDAYRKFIGGLIIIAAVSFAPCFVLSKVFSFQNAELIGLVHGLILDVIVFLALPTIYSAGNIFPIKTLQIFQRFFTSALLIAFAQLLFMMLGLIGMVPLVFLLFAGQFLILHNSGNLIDVMHNVRESANLAKESFGLIFWSFLGITVVTILPEVFFRISYMFSHPEIVALAAQGEEAKVVGSNFSSKALQLTEDISKEDSFQMWGSLLHVIVRPLKSLFLAFLFLACLGKIDALRVQSYLQFSTDEGNSDEAEPEEIKAVEPTSPDED